MFVFFQLYSLSTFLAKFSHRKEFIEEIRKCIFAKVVRKTKTDRETKLKRNVPEKSRAGGEQNFGTGERSRVQRPGTGSRPVGH